MKLFLCLHAVFLLFSSKFHVWFIQSLSPVSVLYLNDDDDDDDNPAVQQGQKRTSFQMAVTSTGVTAALRRH